MAQHRRAERLHHARRHQARAGAEQDSFVSGQHQLGLHAVRWLRRLSSASAARIASTAAGGTGCSGGRGCAAFIAAQRERRLQSGHAVRARRPASTTAPAGDASPSRRRSGPSRTASKMSDAQFRRHAADREDRAVRAERERGVIGRARSGEHGESVFGPGEILAELHHVAVGFLDADDVRMAAEDADRIRQQVDAGVHRHVVEQHRHRRSIGDRRVVTHERVGRHLPLVERRRANEDGVDAEIGGALRRGDRRRGRFAAGAGEQRPILRHRARGRS